MSFDHDPEALLGRHHTPEEGLRVRLRLARSSDADAIRRLLASQGSDGLAFATKSLVHFDPRRRYVLCASALIDSTETLVGLGAIELDGDEARAPRVLIVDPRYSQVAELLLGALMARAREAARARAA